jgi:hypothetical protein
LFCFASEQAFDKLCQKFSAAHIYIQDVFMVICLLATINVWRGLWGVVELAVGEGWKSFYDDESFLIDVIRRGKRGISAPDEWCVLESSTGAQLRRFTRWQRNFQG